MRGGFWRMGSEEKWVLGGNLSQRVDESSSVVFCDSLFLLG